MVGRRTAVQWPKFTICQPDPILGEVYSGKGGMSPEQTLVEFISTSASFHSVKKQPLRSLELDILKVFPNNVMPANAAAWYMAKRKFYLNQAFDQQLLPFLLKKFPEKFRIFGEQVIFLEVYDRETARQKLHYLVEFGLHAYFSHKVEEYGVYFFDPYYYENTEPFHESLREVTGRPAKRGVHNYFSSAAMQHQFTYRQHTSFLISISKQNRKVQVITNTTGVIVSMINSQYGFIKFGEAEKALFCAKSLFKDGWQFKGDPLQLPAMKFDGYKMETGGSTPGPSGESHTWYAVLVWCGRRPSPQHCSTTEDLNSTPVFREGKLVTGSLGEAPRLRQPNSSVKVGRVVEVRKEGAVVMVGEEGPQRVWVPGWRRKLANSPGMWFGTVDGETIKLGDLVTYFMSQEAKEGFSGIGKNVTVLKSDEKIVERKGRRRRKSTRCSDDTDADVKILERARRIQESDSETDVDYTVSEGELEWLDKDLDSIIAVEDPKAKTMDLLKAVQSNLQEARGEPGKKKSLLRADRPNYRPMPHREEDFWRLKKMLGGLDREEYHSETDADYKPGDELEEVERSEEEEEATETGESSFYLGREGRETETEEASNITGGSWTSARSEPGHKRGGAGAPGSNSKGFKLPYWVRACSKPETFDPKVGKFVPVDRRYKEELDPDYLPETDTDTEVNSEGEDFEEEVKLLVREASQDLPDNLLGNINEVADPSKPMVSPVKITLTPAKEDGKEGEEDAEGIVTLVSGDEEAAGSKERKLSRSKAGPVPSLWVKELLIEEQGDDYDSDEDEEYVPPPTLGDTSLEYDEYSSGEAEVSPDEVSHLVQESQALLEPPKEYIAIWVKVNSAEERIARAKEESCLLQTANNKEDTSRKDSDSTDRKSRSRSNCSLELVPATTLDEAGDAPGEERRSCSVGSREGIQKIIDMEMKERKISVRSCEGVKEEAKKIFGGEEATVSMVKAGES